MFDTQEYACIKQQKREALSKISYRQLIIKIALFPLVNNLAMFM